MNIVSPENWYKIFWICYAIGAAIIGYFVIKWAVIAAIIETRK